MITVKTVEHIVIGIIGCLIVLNIFLNFNRTKNDTVNVILKNWAYNKYFFITFFWGVLGGHFFLGSRMPLFGDNWWLPVILLVVIVIIMIVIGKRLDSKYVLKRRYQLVLLLAGVLYGHFIWSQRHLPNIDLPWF